ncbi:hypothetical protein Ancab_024252 [Ancistrocladus abbreviatus]
MDQTQKREEMKENKKSCTDCKATRTPLWRTGPAGPRTLCNACGIRYRKRKVGEMGQEPSKSTVQHHHQRPLLLLKKEKSSNSSTTSSASIAKSDGRTSRDDHDKFRESMKMRLVDVGKEMMFQSTTKSPVKRQRSSRKLGEVEEAAILLMSLSWGSVFA